MTDVQFESGDDQILTAKYDSGCFFYQLLLVIGDPIFFGGFKMGYGLLDQSGLGAIFLGPIVDGDFIFASAMNAE